MHSDIRRWKKNIVQLLFVVLESKHHLAVQQTKNGTTELKIVKAQRRTNFK